MRMERTAHCQLGSQSVCDCVSMRVSPLLLAGGLPPKPPLVLDFLSLLLFSGGAVMGSLQSWS